MIDIQQIIDYECGEMDEFDVIALFQQMIDDGSAWTLQGHYGRMATSLLDAGLCSIPKDQVPD